MRLHSCGARLRRMLAAAFFCGRIFLQQYPGSGVRWPSPELSETAGYLRQSLE
jgi:hypothetical protein